MLRVTAASTEGKEIESEVDEALETFDKWYKNVQQVTDPEDGSRVPIGLVPVERAAIKTFLGFYLGVGGHYTPPKD